MEALELFSDACVKGEPYVDAAGRRQRAREGIALGAWVGWIGEGIESCPAIVEGTAPVGAHTDPNRAELRALNASLKETWKFVQAADAPSSLGVVVAHIDNRVVAETMAGQKTSQELKALQAIALEFQVGIEDAGLEVRYELVWGTAPGLKRAHELSQRAFKEVELR